MSEESNRKPVVEYPCPWGYKVVGPDEKSMRRAVKETLDLCLTRESGDRDFELGLSRTSSTGKYVSLSLNLTVLDEAERDGIFTALNRRTEILLVI
jgi:putative lipoic acid-binding regulatory protein